MKETELTRSEYRPRTSEGKKKKKTNDGVERREKERTCGERRRMESKLPREGRPVYGARRGEAS